MALDKEKELDIWCKEGIHHRLLRDAALLDQTLSSHDTVNSLRLPGYTR